MKRWLPWLLLLVPVAGIAETKEADITITCGEGGCSAVPAKLSIQHQKLIRVTSVTKWQCSIYNPDADATDESSSGQVCQKTAEAPPGPARGAALIFRSLDRSQSDVVVVPIKLILEKMGKPVNPAPQPNSPLLPISAMLLAALSAGLSLMLLLNAGSGPQLLFAAQETLRADLQPLQAMATRAAGSLAFQPLPVPRRDPGPIREAPVRETGPSEETRRTVDKQDVKLDRRNFMASVDGWTKLAPTIPPEIRKQSDILIMAGPGIDAPELQRIAETITQVAVRSTDEMADASNDAARLDDALRKLVQSAGLTLIEPQVQEAYDESRHLTSAATLSAPSAQLRGHVAKVKRRGLARFGRVVAKAEVILYD